MMQPSFMVTISSKIGAVQNWLKTQPKNFFSGGIKKKTCEMLEPVR
jgi:hypothetical protein